MNRKLLIINSLIIMLVFSACTQVETSSSNSNTEFNSLVSSAETSNEALESTISDEISSETISIKEISSVIASSIASVNSTINSSRVISSQASSIIQASSIRSAVSSNIISSKNADPQVESFFYVGKHDINALENWVIEQWNKTSGVNQVVYAKTCEWGSLDMDNADWAGSSTTSKSFQGYKTA